MSKIALITGGSSGIGLSLANLLHADGFKLVLIARREDLLKKIVDRFNSERLNSAKYLVADLSCLQSPDRMGIKDIESFIQNNEVHLLVNNAGFGSFGRFESLDVDHEERMIILNCLAPMRLSHAVIPQMRIRREGSIVTISSLAGFQPLSYMATYGATKAFDLFFASALHHELKHFGINSLAVCPGPVDTEFAGVARVPGQVTGMQRDSVDAVAKEIMSCIKLRKEICVPGFKAKLYLPFLKLLPLRLKNKIVERALRMTLNATGKK